MHWIRRFRGCERYHLPCLTQFDFWNKPCNCIIDMVLCVRGCTCCAFMLRYLPHCTQEEEQHRNVLIYIHQYYFHVSTLVNWLRYNEDDPRTYLTRCARVNEEMEGCWFFTPLYLGFRLKNPRVQTFGDGKAGIFFWADSRRDFCPAVAEGLRGQPVSAHSLFA